MRTLRLVWRLPSLAGWILFGLAWALTGLRWMGPSGRKRSLQVFARGVLFFCGVRLAPQGDTCFPAPCLVVSNHISWIDIFVLQALEPITFIAKSDIRTWPVVGPLVTASGTLYIERGRRTAIREVMAQAQAMLDQGARIMFFPEGTTSSGEQVLKFHANLFALVEERPSLTIRPLSLQYLQHGARTTVPAYIDDMSLVESIVCIMKTPGLCAAPLLHPPMQALELLPQGEVCRRALASALHPVVAAPLGLSAPAQPAETAPGLLAEQR
ncbi:MAG: 1-acyl-sn-glycerol-3-phosphate acyltransferase [Betaproteobacteria bacterium]|nr:1-acyl-sn-glycerol-3-phosphate acyltransferase [Betaproteobacteria bacterium]